MHALEGTDGEQWAAMGIMMTPEINEILDDILNGIAVGVSGGYFKEEFGTVSWILENTSGT